MTDLVSGDYTYHAGERAMRRKLDALLRAPATGWWRLAVVLVCEQAAELANGLNSRPLWERIDAVYARGEPWHWPED